MCTSLCMSTDSENVLEQALAHTAPVTTLHRLDRVGRHHTMLAQMLVEVHVLLSARAGMIADASRLGHYAHATELPSHKTSHTHTHRARDCMD